MLDAIIISGLSGALIIFMVMGLGKAGLIQKKHKEGFTWKESAGIVLGKSIFSWLLVIYSLLVVGVLISGLIISIASGS